MFKKLLPMVYVPLDISTFKLDDSENKPVPAPYDSAALNEDSCHQSWTPPVNSTIQQVLQQTDELGKFTQTWYQSSCAILFETSDGHRHIVGSGTLTQENTVTTSRHVFENGEGNYFCRFYHYQTHSVNYIDRPITDKDVAPDGQDSADVILENLDLKQFNTYCKVINKQSNDQPPCGQVVMFHFSGGNHQVAVGTFNAVAQLFQFQHDICIKGGQGASGANVLIQQLVGTVTSLGLDAAAIDTNNNKAVVLHLDSNRFRMPTPATAPYYVKYNQHHTLRQQANGVGPEFLRIYNDQKSIDSPEHALNCANALITESQRILDPNHRKKNLKNGKLRKKKLKNGKLRKKIFKRCKTFIKEINNLSAEQRYAQLIAINNQLNIALKSNHSEKEFLTNKLSRYNLQGSDISTEEVVKSIFDYMDTYHMLRSTQHPQKNAPYTKIPCVPLCVFKSHKKLIKFIHNKWQQGIVFDHRVDEQVDGQLRFSDNNPTNSSSIVGAMRSIHHDTAGTLPKLNMPSNQDPNFFQFNQYHMYCQAKLNSGATKLKPKAHEFSGYVEYTGFQLSKQRFVLDYVNGIVYFAPYHYNYFSLDTHNNSSEIHKDKLLEGTHKYEVPWIKIKLN